MKISIEFQSDLKNWQRLGFNVVDSVFQLGKIQMIINSDGEKKKNGDRIKIVVERDQQEKEEDLEDLELPLYFKKKSSYDSNQKIEGIIFENLVSQIDHVVFIVKDLEAIKRRMEQLGIERRKELKFKNRTMNFYKFDSLILELVQLAHIIPEKNHFYGLALESTDLEKTKHYFGDSSNPIKKAIQKNRFILTLNKKFLEFPVVFLSSNNSSSI